MHGPMMDDSLLTEQELAAHLKVSRKTIQRMLDACQIPRPIVIGSSKRWKWGTIRRWQDALDTLQTMGIQTIQGSIGQSGTSEDSD